LKRKTKRIEIFLSDESKFTKKLLQNYFFGDISPRWSLPRGALEQTPG
jgi:hypothetical protein